MEATQFRTALTEALSLFRYPYVALLVCSRNSDVCYFFPGMRKVIMHHGLTFQRMFHVAFHVFHAALYNVQVITCSCLNVFHQTFSPLG